MSRLPRSFNWGDTLYNKNPELYEQLNKMYRLLLTAINTKAGRVYSFQTSPNASSHINENYTIGDIWINTSADSAWIMTSRTDLQNVTWTAIT